MGRAGGREQGRGGSGPAGSPARPPRPAARSRPPQPHAQVHKSARFLRPPGPFPGRRRRRLLCEATRAGPEAAGCRWGRPMPSPGPPASPREGWVGGRPSEVSSAGFLRNYDGSPAPVICCLPLSPALFPPFPLSPLLRRPKRQAKPAADEGFWDCSVCTFRNSAEAFKCSICDVRKGTSTRYCYLSLQDFPLFFFFFPFFAVGGEGSELYFLPSFQLVDYGVFCICAG